MRKLFTLWQKWISRRLRLPNWLIRLSSLLFLLLVLLGLFAHAMFQGGTVSWFLFYGMLPFLGYGLLLSAYPLGDFAVERKLAGTELQAGNRLQVELFLRRRWLFPLFYLSFQDYLPEKWHETGVGEVGKIVAIPLFQKKLWMLYEIDHIPRGEYHLEQIDLQVRDILGLVRFRKRFLLHDTVLVYPAIEKIDIPMMMSDYELGKMEAAVKLNRDTSAVSGVREYTPGDRMTKIDWKSTAKRSTLMTKDFEDKRSQDVLLLLDTHAETEMFEKMVSFCASYLCAGLDASAEVGLYLQQENPVYYPLRRGKEQRQQCLLELARVEATDKEILGFPLLENNRSSQNEALVYMTSCLTEEKINHFVRLTDHHQGRWLVVFHESFAEKTEAEKVVEKQALRRGLQIIYR